MVLSTENAATMKGDAILKGVEVPQWTEEERTPDDGFLVLKFKS